MSRSPKHVESPAKAKKRKKDHLSGKILDILGRGFDPLRKEDIISRIDIRSSALGKTSPRELEKMMNEILRRLKKRKEIREQFRDSPVEGIYYTRTYNRSAPKD